MVLKSAADCLRKCNRGSDIIGRIGGEEFCIFLPDTCLDSALVVAEKIRKAVESAEIALEHESVKVTASIGVASDTKKFQDIKHIQSVADQAMYRAKAQGRNRVTHLEHQLSLEEA